VATICEGPGLVATVNSPGARRLDPFIFPAETRARFRLLILATLLLDVNLAFAAQEIILGPLDRAAPEQALARFRWEPSLPADVHALAPAEIAFLRRQWTGAGAQLKQRLPRLEVAGLLLCMLLAIAAAFYRTHPRRLRHRHRAVSLDPDRAPRVAAYLRRCAAALGVKNLRLECRPGFGEAQTYGLRRREVLLLHGSPEFIDRSWGDTARAIALHELGHIVNGDAADREKAKACWSSVLVFLTLLLGVVAVEFGWHLVRLPSHGGSGSWLAAVARLLQTLYPIGWRLGALLLLMRALWAGLIRVRELYADWRVVSWGQAGALDAILRLRERRRRWWESLLRLHPSYHARRRALADPDRLFAVSPDLALVTGLLLSLVFVNGVMPLVELNAGLWGLCGVLVWRGEAPLGARLPPVEVALSTAGPTLLLDSAVLLAVSYLVTASLGVQVQRAAVAGLARGRILPWGYLRLLVPALLVALGMEAGLLITPLGTTSLPAARLSTLPLWLLGFTLLTWLWLVYLRAMSRLTLGLCGGATPPHRLRALIALSGALLLTVLYWPAALTRILLLFANSGLQRFATPEMRQPLVFLAVGAVTNLVILAVAAYALWLGLALFAVVLWQLRQRESCCPVCAAAVHRGFVLGRACEACGELLASWTFAAPIADPIASPDGGRPA
jgi:hypothetical protein